MFLSVLSLMKYGEERLWGRKEICTALHCFCDVPELTDLHWLFPVYVMDGQYFEDKRISAYRVRNLKAYSHWQFYYRRSESGLMLVLPTVGGFSTKQVMWKWSSQKRPCVHQSVFCQLKVPSCEHMRVLLLCSVFIWDALVAMMRNIS